VTPGAVPVVVVLVLFLVVDGLAFGLLENQGLFSSKPLKVGSDQAKEMKVHTGVRSRLGDGAWCPYQVCR